MNEEKNVLSEAGLAADSLRFHVQLLQIWEDGVPEELLEIDGLDADRETMRRMKKLEKKNGSRCCAFCGKVDEERSFLRCSKCKLARCCSQICQKRHWNMHKNDCKT